MRVLHSAPTPRAAHVVACRSRCRGHALQPPALLRLRSGTHVLNACVVVAVLPRSYQLSSSKIVSTQAACTAAGTGCLLPGSNQCY